MTMEWQKLILYAALAMVCLTLWTNWQKQAVHPAVPAAETRVMSQAASQVGDQQAALTSPHDVNNQQQVLPVAVPESRIVDVQTDVLNVKIDTKGGNIIYSSLPKYTQELNNADKPYVIFNHKPDTLYLAQSRLSNLPGKPSLQFQSAQKQYEMTQDQKDLSVTLHWQNQKGLAIKKIFRFKPNSYLINTEYQIKNTGDKPLTTQEINQFLRKKVEQPKQGLFHISAYLGASISDPAKKLYEKISFKNMSSENLNKEIKGGWVAMQEHYFLSAWVPNSEQTSRYFSKALGNDLFRIGYVGPKVTIAPGETKSLHSQLYVGPENMKSLKQIAPGLDMTIDYGWLWFISVILFRLMEYIYQIVGNWGWSIVLVTVLIKAAFYKLSASSYRSMANMRKLQPKIESLKERYGDDKQKMSKSMMELYKKEKINPLGGCLPIVVQIPVFIGLYWVLIESVELRHAPFIFWIKDLSAPDPFYILPIIMGVTMMIQQKLNPPPPDPMQAKVMMMLPVLFTFLFLYFPSGLVLYWVVNNVLSVLQQWYITRQFEAKKS